MVTRNAVSDGRIFTRALLIGISFVPVQMSGRGVGASMTQRVGGRGELHELGYRLQANPLHSTPKQHHLIPDILLKELSIQMLLIGVGDSPQLVLVERRKHPKK